MILAETEFITNIFLRNLINFLAPVVAIALVVFGVIQAFHIFKGDEKASVKKLICGVLILLFILGIMYAAGSFQTYGEAFKGLTDKAITSTSDDASTIMGD